MQIELNSKQYEKLLKLVFLGEWMINAHHIGNDKDPRHEEYDEIKRHLYKHAKEAGLENFVEYDKKANEWYASWEFEMETDVHQFQEEYDEDVFWSEFSRRLADRDAHEKYGSKKLKAMSGEKRIALFSELEDKYEKEIEKNGLKNIRILLKPEISS